jgi:putative flippase GtrA
MKNLHNALRQIILSAIDFFYKPFEKFLSLQTFRYAACGGANTLFDICLFSMSYNLIFKKHNLEISQLTLSPHIASLFFAFCFSQPSGFYLNRYVVFREAGLRRRTQLIRYLSVALICVVFNYIFMKFFVDYLGWYPTPSKIFTTFLVIIFSYTSQTYYLFRLKPQK